MAPEQDENESEQGTRAVVEQLYAAYFEGDADAMVATMSDDVGVRFLGRCDFRGKDEAREFFGANAPMLVDLDFRIRKLLVDGSHAAAVWEESATTVHGDLYENHGVDVFRVEDDQIATVHENNDIRVHRRHFGSDG